MLFNFLLKAIAIQHNRSRSIKRKTLQPVYVILQGRYNFIWEIL